MVPSWYRRFSLILNGGSVVFFFFNYSFKNVVFILYHLLNVNYILHMKLNRRIRMIEVIVKVKIKFLKNKAR